MTVTKKKKKKLPENKKLNPKEDKFCRNYTQTRAFFGNGTFSYADAFGYDLESMDKNAETQEDWDEEKGKSKITILEDSEYTKAYNVCTVLASRMLGKVKINERITDLLNEMATDKVVDGVMMRNMLQEKDLKASNTAMGEYNKVRARITNKMKVEGLSLKELYEAAMKEE